jgi:hypothetical protein
MTLSHEEELLFRNVIRTEQWDLFGDRYFILPMSGTWYTPEDREEQWKAFLDLWYMAEMPHDKLLVDVGDAKAEFVVFQDPYYGREPIFLQRHGFRTMPWMREFLSPQITRGAAETGSGSGKTGGVAIRALTYCALFPGFRFLNVAARQYTADLMLGEIEKWVLNSPFRKFVVSAGNVNPLWSVKPYPTITVEVIEGQPSTFICQTVGQEGIAIIGGERDWINVDEAQLLTQLAEINPILVTRLRGTRLTGVPRWSKLTWISNPGLSSEWNTLRDNYRSMMEKEQRGVLVLEELSSDLNIYVTKRQLEEQRRSLTEREQERWLSGISTHISSESPFPEEAVERCRNNALTEEVEKIGVFHDSFGLLEYELPYDNSHTYVVTGDVGKSHLNTMNSQNVPCVMVWDITDFLEIPIRLAAFYWMDGQNTYETFQDKFIYACMKYRARSYYDATNIQSALEDVGGFKNLPATQPVFFSGSINRKRWAVSVAALMMQNGLFEWPHIRGLWHQCRMYNPSSRKVPDDIIATILVFMFALGEEQTLWTRITERFKFDPRTGELEEREGEDEEMDELEKYLGDKAPHRYDRHSRLFA